MDVLEDDGRFQDVSGVLWSFLFPPHSTSSSSDVVSLDWQRVDGDCSWRHLLNGT